MKKIMENIKKRSGLFGLILLFTLSVSCQNFFWSHTGGTIEEPPVIENCVEFGYLYNWYAVTDARNIAADGWHVPTVTEYNTLITYVGGISVAGGKLKSTSADYFNPPNVNATDEFNFNARGNGYRQNGFHSFKSAGYIHSTRDKRPLFISSATAQGYVANVISPVGTNGYAARVIKNSTTLSNGETGVYIGNDGKIYPTICIGTQEWLAANLAETLYRNGDPIPTVEDNTTWAGLTTGAKCAYNNDYTNVGCGE